MVTGLVQAPVGVGRDQAARLQSAADGLDRFIENRIEDVLNRVNIPSRSDIERLNRSVDVLTTKVEALLSRQRGGN
jgi:polyhydroxyalkanoate synthesis regulator phasin